MSSRLATTTTNALAGHLLSWLQREGGPTLGLQPNRAAILVQALRQQGPFTFADLAAPTRGRSGPNLSTDAVRSALLDLQRRDLLLFEPLPYAKGQGRARRWTATPGPRLLTVLRAAGHAPRTSR